MSPWRVCSALDSRCKNQAGTSHYLLMSEENNVTTPRVCDSAPANLGRKDTGRNPFGQWPLYSRHCSDYNTNSAKCKTTKWYPPKLKSKCKSSREMSPQFHAGWDKSAKRTTSAEHRCERSANFSDQIDIEYKFTHSHAHRGHMQQYRSVSWVSSVIYRKYLIYHGGWKSRYST